MSEEKRSIHNTTEKTVFIIGLFILLGIIGYLVYLIQKERTLPPVLVVTSAYKPDLKPYGFEVKVENFGEEAASNVSVKLELYQDGKTAGSGTVQMDYVPISSNETAWITFDVKRKPGDSLVINSITATKP